MFLKSRAGPITFEFVYLGYFCLKYLYCVTQRYQLQEILALFTLIFFIYGYLKFKIGIKLHLATFEPQVLESFDLLTIFDKSS